MLDLQLHVFGREHLELLIPRQMPLRRDAVGRNLCPGGDAEPVGDVVLVHAILDGGDATAAGVAADDDVFDLQVHHAVFEN